MVRESNQNGFFIQIDASSFAEFEISEFEISRVDCMLVISSLPTSDEFWGLLIILQTISTKTMPHKSRSDVQTVWHLYCVFTLSATRLDGHTNIFQTLESKKTYNN